MDIPSCRKKLIVDLDYGVIRERPVARKCPSRKLGYLLPSHGRSDHAVLAMAVDKEGSIWVVYRAPGKIWDYLSSPEGSGRILSHRKWMDGSLRSGLYVPIVAAACGSAPNHRGFTV